MALDSEAQVLCDDVLVIDDEQRALAGPRCIDLRRDSARHFGVGTALGVVGTRERWRLQLPGVAPQTPLKGWIELAWGDDLAVDPMAPSEVFTSIVRNQSLRFMPPDVDQLMGLVALPSLRLTRPPGIEKIDQAMEALTRLLRDDA
jgi:hypothetical protein